MADFIRSIIRSTAISTSCENNQNIEKQFLDQSGCRRDFLSEGRGKNFLQMNGFLIFLNLADTSAKEGYTYHLGVWLSDMSEWESVRESLLWEAESPSSNGPPSFASTFEQTCSIHSEHYKVPNFYKCHVLGLFHEWGSLFQRCDIESQNIDIFRDLPDWICFEKVPPRGKFICKLIHQ